MDKIDIIGLPSGFIIAVTTNQLNYLKKDYLVYKVKNYKGIKLDEYCYMDSKIQEVKSKALEQILDEITDDNNDNDGEYDEEYF